jgi:hypothetical protein
MLATRFSGQGFLMCNLYLITTNQAAIRNLFKVTRDSAGSLPPMPGVFPDYPAPVVRNAGAERELTHGRRRIASSVRSRGFDSDSTTTATNFSILPSITNST